MTDNTPPPNTEGKHEERLSFHDPETDRDIVICTPRNHVWEEGDEGAVYCYHCSGYRCSNCNGTGYSEGRGCYRCSKHGVEFCLRSEERWISPPNYAQAVDPAPPQTTEEEPERETWTILRYPNSMDAKDRDGNLKPDFYELWTGDLNDAPSHAEQIEVVPRSSLTQALEDKKRAEKREEANRRTWNGALEHHRAVQDQQRDDLLQALAERDEARSEITTLKAELTTLRRQLAQCQEDEARR